MGYARDGIVIIGKIHQPINQTDIALEVLTALHGAEMYAAHGTAQHGLQGLRTKTCTAQKTGTAINGREISAKIGRALHGQQEQNQKEIITATGGTA